MIVAPMCAIYIYVLRIGHRTYQTQEVLCLMSKCS